MIRIEKDKILQTNFELKERSINNVDLPYHLNSPIEFGEGVTLERLFNIILENKEIFNIIFSGHMGGYLIDYYVEEFNKPADEDNDWIENISHCEVYGYFEHWNFEGEEENNIYYGFHGKGIKPDETNYGFMGSSLNNYKHLPMKVDNNIKFVIDTGGKLHGKNKISFEEKYKTIHEGDFPITVFEFIGAILHEISYMGLPEDRDAEFDKMNETSKRIDSGEEELFEMLWDDDGEVYFQDKDGNKEYPSDRIKDDE